MIREQMLWELTHTKYTFFLMFFGERGGCVFYTPIISMHKNIQLSVIEIILYICMQYTGNYGNLDVDIPAVRISS